MKQLRLGVLAGLFVIAGVLSWAGARLWDSVGTLPERADRRADRARA